MTLRKSISTNFVIYSPFIMAAAWMAYSFLARGPNSQKFIGLLILIVFCHFIRYQLKLRKHYISINDIKIQINSTDHNIQLDLNQITDVGFSDNILSLSCSGVDYKFNLAMYNVQRVNEFVDELKIP